MFSKIGSNAVKHSTGFIVQRTSRYEVKYIEGDHILLLEVEPGIDLGIYKESIRAWEEPFYQEVITNYKMKEIISNVDKALDFLNIKHSFI